MYTFVRSTNKPVGIVQENLSKLLTCNLWFVKFRISYKNYYRIIVELLHINI